MEANGDKNLVDRLSKLPVDKQPFWFINWQALEEQRKKPQTYPLRPSPFNDRPQDETAASPPTGSVQNNGVTPLTSELGNRNGGPDTTSSPAPGYHYPDIFSPTNYYEQSQSANSYSSFNGGALSSVTTTTRRPQPPKRPTPIQTYVSPPNTQLPFVGNRNSNDEGVKENSSSGTFSATNAFQNGNSVFSNFNSVVKSTDNVDPQRNTVVVQTSGAPPPDAPFQLTNSGVLLPNPAVMTGIPSIPNFDPASFQYTNNGVPPNVVVTKFTTSNGNNPVKMNSSIVQSNAGFENKNSAHKNATHSNSSYHNTYHYSYSFQNKYVIPHGGAPTQVTPQISNPGFPVQNDGIPNSNVQFMPPAAPSANVQNKLEANANNKQRVIQTSRSPPVTRVVRDPSKRRGSSEYSYYDY